MKIALAILHADARRGGAERYTADLATKLARLGHDVTIVASTGGDVPPPVRTLVLRGTGLTRTSRYLAFLNALDQTLPAERFDIVHAMLPVRQCDLYHPHAGLAARAMRSGHLKHRHPLQRSAAKIATHLNPRRRLMAATERELLTSPTPPTVICLSHAMQEQAIEHYPNLGPKLATLLNGVDLQRFLPVPGQREAERARLGILPHQTVALMIAQDFERKGLRPALAALAQVGDVNLRLVVAGKPDAAPYRALAQQLGVADRVQFVGAVADPRPLYSAADFFLLPTRHDPCSLVVIEALAMGLPVISTVMNGACELMSDGVHGFVLADPNEVPAMARAMRVLSDATRRAAMQAACVALRPSLSFDTHVERVVELYDQLRRHAHR